VGPQPNWKVVLAIYVKYVMTGANYLNKDSLSTATWKGYAIDAEKLFTVRGFLSSVDFYYKISWTRILVHTLEREEILQPKGTL
jgi:hypothetical protein